MEISGLESKGVFEKNCRIEMKIGILTFHRAHNYGAVLQCFALQETLRRLGHDVRVIDYRQQWIEEFYKPLSVSMIGRYSSDPKSLVFYLKGSMKKFLVSPCRASYFKRFRERFLTLSKPCNDVLPQDIDCYLIGSDQLWSLHCLGGKADPIYMGQFTRPENSIVVGYAVSADSRSVEMLSDDISRHIADFKAISMRERKISAMVSAITGRQCDTCVDPTLLADRAVWDIVIDKKWEKRNYVLVYEVRWKKETRGALRRKAEELAARIGEGCEIIDASGMKFPVEDFVSLFRYARYVVTTSFHGVVFSVIFETPFYALPLWDGYDLRYRELLSSLGASDRFVGMDYDMIPDNIDFSHAKGELEKIRMESIDYLMEVLKDE